MKFLLEHAASALFLDPGLGKTAITLAAIKILKKQGLCEKVLVVAPLRVCYSVWPMEQEKWADFHGLKVVVLHGPKKEERLQEDADIYVINPEGLEWLLQITKVRNAKGKVKVSMDLRRWKKLSFDTLVIDELSKFKHVSSIRFKSMKLVLGTFHRRWGLTGSPAANGLMDLFGQCYMLDQGRSLGPFVTHFRMTYFNPGFEAYEWVIKPGGEEKIYKRLKPLALRMSAEDYLDMPKLVENDIHVTLPDPVLQLYLQLEDDLFTRIEEGVVTAGTAAVASMKCRQVANGGVYLDPEVEALIRLPKSKREWVNLHDAKIDALDDLISELQGKPLLVAYDFNHDLDRIQARFGKDVPWIGGGTTPKRSTALEKAWNAGELPVLFAHPQSVAHGLNLQESGHHVCWHSLTWNYEDYMQFISRVWRQGNKAKRVIVHRIIARGTIDEVMIAAMRSKKKGQQALFDALTARRRERPLKPQNVRSKKGSRARMIG